MKYSIAFSIIFSVYALLYTLPLKIKIKRKHGWNKTNIELIQLAKDGDPDAMKLRKATRILIVMSVIWGLVYAFEKNGLIPTTDIEKKPNLSLNTDAERRP